MYPLYEDITKRLGAAKWYDEHGVPRYDDYEAGMQDIYADYDCLMEIECQSCGRKFLVGCTWSHLEQVGKTFQDMVWMDDGKRYEPKAFPTTENDGGSFGYGDAPWHTHESGWQCSGTTMTTLDKRVVEFWSRNERKENNKVREWVRLPQYEVTFNFEEAR